jgi:hypothetical protein
LRRECLDYMPIIVEARLRQALSSYAILSLQKDAPWHRAVQCSGAIVGVPVLAGLHHRYLRI